jgi:hypothetical protein
MKPLLGEIVVIVAAIAVAIGVARSIAPGQFRDAASATFIAEKQRFYDRLFLAPLISLPAGIVAYCSIQKLRRHLRTRRGATRTMAESH